MANAQVLDMPVELGLELVAVICSHLVDAEGEFVDDGVETYLRGVFGFIGVTKLEFVSADGVAVGPEHRDKALASAPQAATELRAV